MDTDRRLKAPPRLCAVGLRADPACLNGTTEASKGRRLNMDAFSKWRLLAPWSFIAGFAGINEFNAGRICTMSSPENHARVHPWKSVFVLVAYGLTAPKSSPERHGTNERSGPSTQIGVKAALPVTSPAQFGIPHPPKLGKDFVALRSPLAALFAANVLLVLGSSLQSVLVPVRAHLQGFSDPAVGALGAAYYLGFAVGCLMAPRLVGRVGHIRAFAVLAVVAAQTFPLHPATAALPVWVLLRLVGGCCFAGLYMVVESWVNESSCNARRGRSLSIYLMLSAAASVGGQGLLRLVDPMGAAGFLAVCSCVSLSLIPLALSAAAVPQPAAAVRLDLRRLYRTSPAGVIGCLAVGLANGSFWALAPLFVQSEGRSPDQVALFMATAVAGGACLQWPVGRLSDRFDRRLFMLVGCAGALLVALPLALLRPLAWPAELALAFAFGAAAFPLYALCVAHANDHAASGAFIGTSGGLLLTFGLGAAIGPLLAATVNSRVGSGLFLFTAAVHLGFGVVLGWRMGRRAAVPAKARRPFMVADCPAASLFDPFVRTAAAPAPALVESLSQAAQ
jgi:MFS family permease